MLPQELLDMVVEHLSAYPNDLKSLALSHRSFVHPTRRILFRLIDLSNIRSFVKFSALLDASPRLRPLIQHLLVAFDSSKHWPYGHDKAVLNVLRNVPRLRIMAVTDSTSSGVDLVRMPEQIRDAFLQILAQENVKVLLALHRCGRPGFLGSFPAIQYLTLTDADLEDVDNLFLPPEIGMKRPLHTLRFSRTKSTLLDRLADRILEQDRCGVDFSSVKRLAVSFPSFTDTHIGLSKLLKCATSLEHLSLQPAEAATLFSEFDSALNQPSVRDLVHLHNCPSLQTVTIQVMYEIRLHVGQPDGPTVRIRPCRWLCHFLTSASSDPTKNHIHTVKIQFRFPSWYGRDELKEDHNRDLLELLDGEIAGALESLPKLRKVVVAIGAIFDPPEQTPFEETKEHVRESMPMLTEKGLLDVIDDPFMSPMRFT